MKKRKIIKQIVCLSLTLVGLIGMSEKVIAEEIQDYDIQSIIKEDVIEQTLEQKNSVMGSSMSNNQVLSTFSLGKSLNASDATLPNKDFIDVSSWNGALTVDQYKKMKSYGVKGVVVKLSEGDYYVNPQRFIQIKNAQTAGLTVSAYHYSKFSTEAGAKKEANYFVNAISNTGLLKNVTLVNDAEDSSMVSGHVTNNSIIFANTLKSHGYSNVVHYSMASWITGGNPKLNPSVLGKSNIWVAQYPYTPNKNNLLHSDYAAWQWASDLTFSGVTTPIGGNFDINMDYLGRFTNKTYDSIEKEVKTSFKAKIKESLISEKHGLWDDVYNTHEGIRSLGKGSKFANKNVTISATVKTSRSTYWKFTVDGTNYWMDMAAFTPTLYTVQKSEQVNYTVVVKPNSESAKQGIWTAPWNTTLDGKYLGHGGMYAGKTVQVSRIVTLNTGSTYYEFTVNGKLIGWLDAQAFYEPIIEEIDVNYSVEIVDSAKNQGAWSAPYNTESNIIGYGKGSQYVGQQGTVDKIVRTTRSGYWRVTLDGKTFWLDEVSFKKVVKKATIDISDENESDTIDSSQSETEESIINTSETSEPSNKDGIVESSDNIENIMEQTSSDSIIDSEEVMESTVD